MWTSCSVYIAVLVNIVGFSFCCSIMLPGIECGLHVLFTLQSLLTLLDFPFVV